MAWLTDVFRNHYLESLTDYKSFYDDIHEYGNPNRGEKCIYFVPGYNGAAGQIRFAFPSFSAYYGPDIYVRSCYLKEFSARKPIWEKYTVENLRKRRQKIVTDLEELALRFREIDVITSSSGFFDFLAALTETPSQVREKLKLAWVACAPDSSRSSPWESRFFKINGFEYDGHRWFSYPNHNVLKFLNPECNSLKKWQYGAQRKVFFKHDLESRFWLGGILWDYLSFSNYNWMNQKNVEISEYPIDLPSVVLVATEDGYWMGKSREVIEATIHKFIKAPEILYRKTSHLWVTVPENICATIHAVEKQPLRHSRSDRLKRSA